MTPPPISAPARQKQLAKPNPRLLAGPSVPAKQEGDVEGNLRPPEFDF